MSYDLYDFIPAALMVLFAISIPAKDWWDARRAKK